MKVAPESLQILEISSQSRFTPLVAVKDDNKRTSSLELSFSFNLSRILISSFRFKYSILVPKSFF